MVGDGAGEGRGPSREETPRERLARESGVLPWSELVRHFARGVLVRVGPDVALLDAALCLVENDTARLQSWLDTGAVARASDDDARDWTARKPAFTCVVAAPWVLVREVASEEGDSAEP